MLSEQDVDRELKAALSVSPSPDFEARVFLRVAGDRPSHWSSHYGWFAAAASVIIIIIIAAEFYVVNRRSTVVAPPTQQIVQRTAPRVLIRSSEAPAHRDRSAPPRVETVRAVRSAPRTAEPEVIVPLNRMEAVRRLVRAVNEGRLEPPVESIQGLVARPVQLGIAPLVVEPIPLSPLGPAGETATPFMRGVK